MFFSIPIASLGLIALAALLANASPGGDASTVAAAMQALAPLINLGGVGAVLAWMLWKLEPRMRSMEQTIDRNSRANMVISTVIAQLEVTRVQAQGIVNEVDEAESRRNPKQ